MIKRTPIIDKDDQQLYLDNGMRKYAYWIVVTNSQRSDTAVLRIAQGRGNQENLIKDFKHGLGLSHVPTGSLAANQAYFLIAALAWNLKTLDAESAPAWRWSGAALQALSVPVDLPSGDRSNDWAGQCAAQAACR